MSDEISALSLDETITLDQLSEASSLADTDIMLLQDANGNGKKIKGDKIAKTSDLDNLKSGKVGVAFFGRVTDALDVDTTGNSNGLIRFIFNVDGSALNCPEDFKLGFQQQLRYDANNILVKLTEIESGKIYTNRFISGAGWQGWNTIGTENKHFASIYVEVGAGNVTQRVITLPNHNYTHFQIVKTPSDDWVECSVSYFNNTQVKVIIKNHYNGLLAGNLELYGYY